MSEQITFTFRNADEKRAWLERLLNCDEMALTISYGWQDPEGQEPWEVDEIEVELAP